MKRKIYVFMFMLFLCGIFVIRAESVQAADEPTTDETVTYEFQDNKFTAYFDEGNAATYPERKWKISFKVTEPSIVTLNSGGLGLGWPSAEDLNTNTASVAVYNDSGFSKAPMDGTKRALTTNKPIEFQLCLEPGTYYVLVTRDAWGDLGGRKGYINVSLSMEAVDTSLNSAVSQSKAVLVKNNTQYQTALMDNKNRCYYYKMDLTRGGKISVFTLADKLNLVRSSKGYKVSLLDEDGVAVKDGVFQLNGINAVEKSEFSVKKGIYYVKVDFMGTYYSGMTTFKAKIDYFPADPTKIAAKAGAKSITGVTTKNTKVYAVYSGKTYTAKSNGSGKFSIKTPVLKKGAGVQVYAKNDFGSSNEKKVKVK